MKQLLLFITFTFSSLSFAQTADTLKWKTLIRAANWETYTHAKDLDRAVLKKFPNWRSMSRVNGRFEATDVGSGPRERLFFIAKYQNCWIVSLEHGGIGYHTHCFFIEETDKGLSVYHSYMEFQTLAKLQSAGNISVQEWDAYDY